MYLRFERVVSSSTAAILFNLDSLYTRASTTGHDESFSKKQMMHKTSTINCAGHGLPKDTLPNARHAPSTIPDNTKDTDYKSLLQQIGTKNKDNEQHKKPAEMTADTSSEKKQESCDHPQH